jgi:N-acetylmuramoyl-L-alanine amidase
MRRIVALITALLATSLPATAADVLGVRAWPAPDHTRIVFDVSGPVKHQIFQLDNPRRLVIDIEKASMRGATPSAFAKDPHLKGLRHGTRNGKNLRVVLDLRLAVQPKSFLLAPNDTYGYRLVVDVRPRSAKPRVAKTSAPLRSSRRSVVIAIDAGHGGDDPGAIGAGGLREKAVTLTVARKLAREISRRRGFKAVLIRDGDYYLRLRQRIDRAREAGADLMVSVHADAFRDRSVRGSSVWVLSTKGAGSEAARWLAARENAADLVGGVSLDDKDDVLAQVLLDLSQTATLNDSIEVGSGALAELARIGPVHKRHLGRAGFVVLKAPDIPSILVETAFISNPSEERRLRDTKHQDRLARALAKGITRHFERKPPAGTLLAQARHIITSGETLSTIAMRYDVSIEYLKTSNSLKNDRVRIGQVLQIPSRNGS